MKRDRGRGNSAETASAAAEKESAWEVNQKQQADAGMDELFAVLGYKVKSSDMADVADKLEQLDKAMATTAEDGVSVLSADTVHYNPSDLSGWVDTMLSELTTSCAFGIGVNSGESGDLRAIPGGAILSSADEDGSDCKRIKTCAGSPPPSAVGRAMVVDSQEAGVRLVHALMACAEAVQNENMKLADALVKHVGVLAVSQAGAMRKVATYFAEALARRIYRIQPRDYSIELSGSDLLQMHFYETAPYLKFAHFTANQAILEAFAGADRVHVLDFSLKDGMQWPALIQALALRPGGPPAFKLTGIGPSQPENSEALQEVGWKLAQVAETIGVKFEFRCLVVDSLADLDVALLDVGPSDLETVVVNSVFEMHRLLARPGSIEKVLDSIKAVSPKIVTIVEQEANHNGASFVDRFNEALHYYSTIFDSLESVGAGQPDGRDVMMTDVYLGRQICNVVACDGEERVERHETLSNWRARMGAGGFEPVHMGSNAFKQASILLALFAGGDGYRVEENEGCLMLGWHTRPLIAASAWRVNAEAAPTR